MNGLGKITGCALLAVSITGEAGLYRTTVHSRANCLNNESITWWAGHRATWRVVSIHKHVPTNQMHLIDTGYHYNDRVAAVHWGEGVHGGFVVWGYHYLEGWNGGMYFADTYAETCNIIEGW